MANPGYGKKSAPDQEPRTGRDFGRLPAREASIAGYLDRLDDEADMSIKTSPSICRTGSAPSGPPSTTFPRPGTCGEYPGDREAQGLCRLM
jgi:hypothetical protein